MVAAVKSGARWLAKAVRELAIPDSFAVGEDCSGECPLQAGDVIELRSFRTGFRGAWFLCEVLAFLPAYTEASPRILVQHLAFPGEKPTQVRLYQLDPNNKGTRCLMVRPVPPNHVQFGVDDAAYKAPSAPVFKQERYYAEGDKVDAFNTNCWWGGTINAIKGKKALIAWYPEPFGEGDKDIWIPFKDLRPSLRWALNKWHIPQCVKGPLGKIVVSGLDGSDATGSLSVPAGSLNGSKASPPTKENLRKRPLESSEGTERSAKACKFVQTPEPRRSGSKQSSDVHGQLNRASPDKKCTTCGTHEKSYWRRGPLGKCSLCNKCGMAYSRHLKRGAQTAEPLPPPHLSPVKTPKKRATLEADCPREGPACPKRKCSECGRSTTLLWRTGPLGPHTLCSSCGSRYHEKVRREKAAAQREAPEACNRKESQPSAEQIDPAKGKCPKCRMHWTSKWRTGPSCTHCSQGVQSPVQHKAPTKPLKFVQATGAGMRVGVMKTAGTSSESSNLATKVPLSRTAEQRSGLSGEGLWPGKNCCECGDCSALQCWRAGPKGPRTLCQKCGQRSALWKHHAKNKATAQQKADAPQKMLGLPTPLKRGIPFGVPAGSFSSAAHQRAGDATRLNVDKKRAIKRGEPMKAVKQSEREVVEGFEESMRDFLKESSTPLKRPASARRASRADHLEMDQASTREEANGKIRAAVRYTSMHKGALQSSARIVKQSLQTREKLQPSEKKWGLKEERSKRAELRRRKKRKIERLKEQLAISMEAPESERKQLTREGASSVGRRRRGRTKTMEKAEKTGARDGERSGKGRGFDYDEVEPVSERPQMGGGPVAKKRRVLLRKGDGEKKERPSMKGKLQGVREGVEGPESRSARAESRLDGVERRVKQRSEQTGKDNEAEGNWGEQLEMGAFEEPRHAVEGQQGASIGLQERDDGQGCSHGRRSERGAEGTPQTMEAVPNERQLGRAEKGVASPQLDWGATEQPLGGQWLERGQQLERGATGNFAEGSFLFAASGGLKEESKGRDEAESGQGEREEGGGFEDEPFAFVDEEEALSVAREQLLRWDEMSIDEIRGLFMMVNTWSPEEDSLEDPLAWYREKAEALVTRGERFLEDASAKNAGRFRSWINVGSTKQPQTFQAQTEGHVPCGGAEGDPPVLDADASKDPLLLTQPVAFGVDDQRNLSPLVGGGLWYSDSDGLQVSFAAAPLVASQEPVSDSEAQPLDAPPKSSDASREPPDSFPEPSDAPPNSSEALPKPSDASREPDAPPAVQLMIKSLLEEYFAELSTEELVAKAPPGDKSREQGKQEQQAGAKQAGEHHRQLEEKTQEQETESEVLKEGKTESLQEDEQSEEALGGWGRIEGLQSKEETEGAPEESDEAQQTESMQNQHEGLGGGEQWGARAP